MSRRLTLLCSFILILLAGSLAAQSIPAVKLPPYEEVTLPNGLTLLLMEKRDVPMIAFNGRIRGGSVADPTGKEGTSEMTAELLEKGAGTRNAQQFAETVESAGGAFDVEADREAIIVSAEFMNRDRGLMLDLISDVLRRPQLPQEEFTKLQKRLVEQITAAKESDPRTLVNYYGDAFLFTGHPYGRGGDESSLALVKHADVVEYAKNQIGADRAIFAFVGDFDARSMAADVRKKFGDWKKAAGTAPKLSAFAPVKGRRVLLVDKPDATQTYFWIGNVGIARNDAERTVLDLANTAFGGRFTSWLNTELRIKSGLSYGARSSINPESTPGTVAITSFTKTESTERALDIAIEQLKKLRGEGLDEATLASVKSYVLGQYAPRIETGVQLAAKLTELELYGLDRSDVDAYAAAVQKADLGAVRKAIARVYPDPENTTIVLIGNADKIRDVARKFGTVTEMKITEKRFAPASR
jgi:zinc protease